MTLNSNDDVNHVSRLMAEAVGLHQRGDIKAARKLYHSVLERQPEHSQALHLLGVIAGQTGEFEQSVDLISLAVSLDPRNAAAHSNLGNALNKTGHHAQALACHDQAIALDPGFAQAHNGRGVALQILQRQREALDAFSHAARLQPAYAEAHLNRGVLLLAMQQLAPALASFEEALALVPRFAGAHQNRGAALVAMERHEEAVASFERALVLDSANPDIQLGHADALTKAGRSTDALQSLDRAIALRPGLAQAHFKKGVVLQSQGQLDEALQCYDCAIALQPTDAEARYNQGTVFQARGAAAEAVRCYQEAIEVRPGYLEARYNAGLCHLLLGDLEAGWPGYECRFELPGTSSFLNRRHFVPPLWNGSQQLRGKNILLYQEQGLGDAVQCARYAAVLAARGATVLLEVAAPLQPLLETAEGVARAIMRGDPLPDFDFHCPLMSLPSAFGTTLATIPAPRRYLRPPASRVEKWRAKVGLRKRPRVGLVWSGNPRHSNDRNRSIPMSLLTTLLPTNVDFFSLQRETGPNDEAMLRAKSDVTHFGVQLQDFADTAALIEEMDLVISVDTSVAHVAGALGKNLWLLLPYAPDWRWMLERSDSPWYPSARLYRQTTAGDWEGVLSRVVNDLRELLA